MADFEGRLEDDSTVDGSIPLSEEPASAMVYHGDLFKCASVAEEMNAAKRNTMEDAHVVKADLLGDGSVTYFGVYDGHGGRDANDAAADIVEFVEEHLHAKVAQELQQEGVAKEQALKQAFQICDLESKQMNITAGGATAAVALLCTEEGERVLYTAGVGDSRVVLGRGSEALRLTVDHKPENADERKRVEGAGGFFLRDRVLGILAVTRSFGDHGMKDFVSAEPETRRVVISDDDQVLIIACDGVWDVFSDQEAVDLIRGLEETQEGQEDAAQKLVDSSVDRGTTDNVTACVVFL